MDDNARIAREDDENRVNRDNRDNESIDQDSEAWPAGLLASQSSGAGSGTAAAGSLAAGPIGAAQAGRLVEAQEPEEERSTYVHVPAAPDEYDFGRPETPEYDFGHRETGDEGVSAPQREAESDELNG